jgi:hypothetical protein
LPDSCLTRKRRGNKGDFFGGVKGVRGVKGVKGVKGVRGVKTNAFVDMKLNSTPYHTGQKTPQHPQKIFNILKNSPTFQKCRVKNLHIRK